MKRYLALSLLAVVAGIGFVASQSPAVPLPADKPVKWEYAELIMRSTSGRAKGFAPADGAQPEQPGQPTTPAMRWVTSDEEITAKNWEELAEKLKAPAPKKEATAASHKLRVLNQLGADGWEMVGQPPTSTGFSTTTAGSWMFKRRAP